MENEEKYPLGQIGWIDLTAPNADTIREFYRKVVGWRSEPVAMDDYEDYNMIPAGSEEPTAGICHALGVNANLPPVWMIYVTVENLQVSMQQCVENGGKIIADPSQWGEDAKICVIQDPAGAYMALYQP
jgi:predicted enzyme related to lactoylglutathione lyase